MKLADSSVRIEPLGPDHDRAAFRCANKSPDRYIREQASQDTRRGVARVFVAVMPEEPKRIAGFFTLSAAWVVASDLPPDVAKRLPRHPIPAALVGRLAVENGFARRGLGSILLADAVTKAMAAAETVAMTVVVVDPIDDAARAFYSAFGFRSLQAPRRTFRGAFVHGTQVIDYLVRYVAEAAIEVAVNDVVVQPDSSAGAIDDKQMQHAL